MKTSEYRHMGEGSKIEQKTVIYLNFRLLKDKSELAVLVCAFPSMLNAKQGIFE